MIPMTLRSSTLALVIVLASTAVAQQPTPAPAPAATNVRPKLNEATQFTRYAADNEQLGPPAAGVQRVVFFGDSITDNWGRKAGSFFPGKPYVNRGISGQTTAQMLLRFQQDVVHLHPTAVIILAGTNDVAENTGPYTDEQIEDNFKSMVAIAVQNHIRVILASIPPADRFSWHPGIEPAARIRTLNTWLVAFAAEQKLVYLDYYSALATPVGAMKPELAIDKAVHPNTDGYALMQPLAEAAISKALAQPAP
jgi:lysophospholipase L1-like esterase